MSTIDDFENALTGATATHIDGRRAIKMGDIGGTWITTNGLWCSTEQVWGWDFALDPLEPAPTTAREALDLAWELAHEVEPGQVIPADTRFLEVTSVGLGECIAHCDFEIDPSHVETIRTLTPLPDPEPDWLDAPAVLDVCGCCGTETLHSPIKRGTCWECTECHTTKTWRALTDVTPLYPKEKK